MTWYKIQNEQVHIQILVKPNAKKSALLKVDERGLHVAIHAKPQQGEANVELIAFLATFFRIPKTKIVLLRGERSKHKVISLPFTLTVKQLINRYTE
jgi:uncharacterized protein (TIGR00251 family)